MRNIICKLKYSNDSSWIKVEAIHSSRVIKLEKELVVYCHNEAYQVIASLEKRLDCKVTILE